MSRKWKKTHINTRTRTLEIHFMALMQVTGRIKKMDRQYYDLELLEDMNYQRNKLRGYSCVIVGGKLKTKVDKDVIARSLKELFILRQRLRLNVFTTENQSPRFREIESP